MKKAGWFSSRLHRAEGQKNQRQEAQNTLFTNKWVWFVDVNKMSARAEWEHCII